MPIPLRWALTRCRTALIAYLLEAKPRCVSSLIWQTVRCLQTPLTSGSSRAPSMCLEAERFDCTIGIHNRSASKHIDGALELPDVNGVCKHRTVCQISELTQRGFASNRYAMRAVRHRVSAQRNGIGMRLSREP